MIPGVVIDGELGQEVSDLRGLRFVGEVLISDGVGPAHFVDPDDQRLDMQSRVRCPQQSEAEDRDDKARMTVITFSAVFVVRVEP